MNWIYPEYTACAHKCCLALCQLRFSATSISTYKSNGLIIIYFFFGIGYRSKSEQPIVYYGLLRAIWIIVRLMILVIFTNIFTFHAAKKINASTFYSLQKSASSNFDESMNSYGFISIQIATQALISDLSFVINLKV